MRLKGGKNIMNDSVRRFSKEELLFLHLLNHGSNQDDYAVTDMVTQEMISNALDCDIGYVSRLLKKNIKKGYIRCKKARTMNKHRLQNAYFLTIKGEKFALKINEFVNNSH